MCLAGNPNGKVTVAIAGDSKILQWSPALHKIAAKNDWRLVGYTKSACHFGLAKTRDDDGKVDESCSRWNTATAEKLLADPPDFLLTSQVDRNAVDADGKVTQEAMGAGLRQTWASLTALGTKVVVISDNPHPGFNVYECVASNPTKLTACAYERDRLNTHSSSPMQRKAVEGQRNVAMIDMWDWICPADRCAPIIGNVLVYRQGSHLTKTYVETLTPMLAKELARVGVPAKLT
jgi:hypothetical protein